MSNKVAENPQWIYDTPALSDVETKLRQLLIELGNEGQIIGVQVCAYKDGEVIIDTAAGVLGEDDPRPVKPDSLFSVFSTTKGITAGMLHWVVDQGKVKLDDFVSSIWPNFGTNGKDQIKVHHVLNHTSGLQNVFSDSLTDDQLIICDWDACLKKVENSTPETEPGKEQLYHYIVYGWLCGGIIEHATGKKFQEILEEAIIRPLNVEGELYIGIPPGVESRLATLTLDVNYRNEIEEMGKRSDLPSSFQPALIAHMLTTFPPLFNKMEVRRAIVPAANGHLSARALARYYAALADGGVVPPPHSSSYKPALGSHPHIPTTENPQQSNSTTRIFNNSRIHDAFLGVGEYEKLALPNMMFGLGFKRECFADGSFTGFGHAGMGGSCGFCDISNRLSIAVTVNKLSASAVTKQIVQLVCSELNIPLPEDFVFPPAGGQKPLIN